MIYTIITISLLKKLLFIIAHLRRDSYISQFADLCTQVLSFFGAKHLVSGVTAGNMLNMIVESFFSKIEEKLFELAEDNTVRDVNYTSTMRTLKRNLKALSARALDVEDEINSAGLSGQKKRKREVENWLEEVKELETEISRLEGEVQSEGFISRFFGEDPAAELKERVDELVEQSKNFGELVLDAPKTMGETLLAPKLVGKVFEENLEKIWEMLRADNVTSIGIYGMGGVGKTSLTKHINNRLVKKKKTRVFWVMVSQESSIRMLQDKIAHVMGVDLSNEYDEDKKAARLYQELYSRKNFVLILDDVWKNISLEKVGIPLGVEGSKLIITTRSLQVCRQIGSQRLILVKTLDLNEAWELFSYTLGQEVTLSLQVEEIAKRMAKVCDGLPLGIITLAGSMRGETAIHVWRNALEELQKFGMEHDDMEDHVFKVLKYSFNRLNPKHQEQVESNGCYTELQCCFLYCSLFPEDDMIEREELVRKFISEELVDKRKTRRAQIDQGHTILDRLLNVCLLESAKDARGVNCMKMHDLVRAMALKITQGKNMVYAGCLLQEIPNEDEYWTKDVEKMSFMRNYIKEVPDGMSPNCPKLSTLLLQRNWDLKFIANSFFSQMHGLCVLDLSTCSSLTKLPNSLSDLESLETLLLGSCHYLREVPYLGKLKALKELDLSNTEIREVPQGMDELANLKFLCMSGAKSLEILPANLLPKFQNLQCLHLPGQIEAPIIEMESLRKLEEFKGRVNDAADFNRLIGCRPLIKYSIIIRKHNVRTVLDTGGCNGVNVGGHNYLMEDVVVLARDAQHLGLEKCLGLSKSILDDFPKFNNPKSLQTLRVIDCEGIECICGELESHSVAPLETLEKIELCSLRDFMGIIQKQDVVLPTPAQAVFSSLRVLDIRGCNKMKNLGLSGSEFPNLEKILVQYCSEIEEIIEEGGVVSFPKLKRLTLWNLPKLKHVGTTIHSIEEIGIERCPALKKLPLYFQVIDDGGESSNVSYSPPLALKRIDLLIDDKEEWWESLEWDHPSHKLLLQPFLQWEILV